MTEPVGYMVTLKDVWIEMAKMRDDMTRMSTNTTLVDAHGKLLGDHETRIRAGERWRYALPISVLMAVSSVGLSITEMIMKR